MFSRNFSKWPCFDEQSSKVVKHFARPGPGPIRHRSNSSLGRQRIQKREIYGFRFGALCSVLRELLHSGNRNQNCLGSPDSIAHYFAIASSNLN